MVSPATNSAGVNPGMKVHPNLVCRVWHQHDSRAVRVHPTYREQGSSVRLWARMRRLRARGYTPASAEASRSRVDLWEE
jgi:hypothetical protein